MRDEGAGAGEGEGEGEGGEGHHGGVGRAQRRHVRGGEDVG